MLGSRAIANDNRHRMTIVILQVCQDPDAGLKALPRFTVSA
ncbi:MAG: hypothetical protein WDO56_18945 [Gammaproteobacteria bacterium]